MPAPGTPLVVPDPTRSDDTRADQAPGGRTQRADGHNRAIHDGEGT